MHPTSSRIDDFQVLTLPQTKPYEMDSQNNLNIHKATSMSMPLHVFPNIKGIEGE
jgi:hypothetical protein